MKNQLNLLINNFSISKEILSTNLLYKIHVKHVLLNGYCSFYPDVLYIEPVL